MPDEEQHLERAADWIDREAELTCAERAERDGWLAASPAHARAYARMHQLMTDSALLEAAGAWQGEPAENEARRDIGEEIAVSPLPAARAPGRLQFGRSRVQGTAPTSLFITRRRVLTAGLFAALVVPLGIAALLGGGPVAPDAVQTQVFASATGKHARHVLPDGSVLVLDAASKLAIRFGDGQRLVDLRRGAARFDVVHDPDRPFIVRSDSFSATALGTSFAVDRLAEAGELRVFEGRVRLQMQEGVAAVLHAGQWANVSPGSPPTVQNFDPASYSGWQSNWLEADNMPLETAIARLNRYSAVPLRLDGSAPGQGTFSGRFRLDRPDESLALIGALFGLAPEDRDGARYLAPSARNSEIQ